MFKWEGGVPGVLALYPPLFDMFQITVPYFQGYYTTNVQTQTLFFISEFEEV
jgi:hypothetical protein